MLGGLIEVVKALAGAFTTIRQLGDERRTKLAALCDKISDVLEGFVEAKDDRRKSINLWKKGSSPLLAQLGNKNHQYKSPADRASPGDDAGSKM